MRPSAHLAREIPHEIDVNLPAELGILVGEDADGAAGFRFRLGHGLGVDGQVAGDDVVDDPFDLAQLLIGELLRVREVKTQTFGRDVGAALLDVRAEDLAKRLLEKMGRGMQARGFDGMVGQSPLERAGGGAGEVLMLLEFGLEGGTVDGLAAFAEQFLGQFQGEAVGRKQLEGLFPVERLFCEHLLEFAEALFEGPAELLLFFLGFLQHTLAVSLKLGIGGAVLGDDEGGEFGQERACDPQPLPFPHGAAQQAADDVTLPDVGRGDATGIPHHEGCGTEMLGDDAERAGGGRIVRTIRLAGTLRDRLDQRQKGIRFKNGLLPLHDRGHAFEAHARVDVLLRERRKRAVRPLIELHEDVVPDLDEPSAVAVGVADGTERGVVGGTGIVKNFGVRTAGTGLAGGTPPVLLFGVGVDPGTGFGTRGLVLIGDAQIRHDAKARELGTPQVDGFLVARGVGITFKNGDVDALWIELEAGRARQELEGPGDGFGLEIIPEGPVAQHLEKGEVAVVADLFDIVGTEAFLTAGEARTHRVRLAEEIGHERMHAGGREEDRGIVFRQQRRGRQDRVALGTEEIEEGLA